MSEPELLAALDPVLETLRSLGVRHYVGGSIASSAHGVARSSVDADVVAELEPQHVAGFVAALEGAYYVPLARIHDAVARRASFNVIHLETMLKIDVFVARDRPFDRRAMERARPAGSGTAADRLLVLASAEDTLLAKLEWYRRGGEVSERQWSDVLGILRIGGAALDLDYLRQNAGELAVADLLDRALGEAGITPA